MIPAPSYKSINAMLNNDHIEIGIHPIPGIPKEVKVVCFLVFDQNYGTLSAKDLLSNLDFIHHRSGNSMYFFLCGVSQYGANDKKARSLGKLEGVELYHNAEATESFVKIFKKEIAGYDHQVGLAKRAHGVSLAMQAFLRRVQTTRRRRMTSVWFVT